MAPATPVHAAMAACDAWAPTPVALGQDPFADTHAHAQGQGLHQASASALTTPWAESMARGPSAAQFSFAQAQFPAFAPPPLSAHDAAAAAGLTLGLGPNPSGFSFDVVSGSPEALAADVEAAAAGAAGSPRGAGASRVARAARRMHTFAWNMACAAEAEAAAEAARVSAAAAAAAAGLTSCTPGAGAGAGTSPQRPRGASEVSWALLSCGDVQVPTRSASELATLYSVLRTGPLDPRADRPHQRDHGVSVASTSSVDSTREHEAVQGAAMRLLSACESALCRLGASVTLVRDKATGQPTWQVEAAMQAHGEPLRLSVHVFREVSDGAAGTTATASASASSAAGACTVVAVLHRLYGDESDFFSVVDAVRDGGAAACDYSYDDGGVDVDAHGALSAADLFFGGVGASPSMALAGGGGEGEGSACASSAPPRV